MESITEDRQILRQQGYLGCL